MFMGHGIIDRRKLKVKITDQGKRQCLCYTSIHCRGVYEYCLTTVVAVGFHCDVISELAQQGVAEAIGSGVAQRAGGHGNVTRSV